MNQIWALQTLQTLLTNHFRPRQKLVSKTRKGAKMTKTYDTPKTLFQRQIQALTAQPQTLATSKKGRTAKPS